MTRRRATVAPPHIPREKTKPNPDQAKGQRAQGMKWFAHHQADRELNAGRKKLQHAKRREADTARAEGKQNERARRDGA